MAANTKTEAAVKDEPKLVPIVTDIPAPGESEYIWVGYQGKGYQVKRGEEVMVPEGVANVLKDSMAAKRALNSWQNENSDKN